MRKNSLIGATLVSALMVAGAVTTAFAQMYPGTAAPGTTAMPAQPPMMGGGMMMPGMPQMAPPMMAMVKYYDGNVYTLSGMCLSRYDATTLKPKGVVMLEEPTSMMIPPTTMPDGTMAKPMPMMHRGTPIFFLSEKNAIVVGDRYFYRVSLNDMRVTQFTVLPDMPAMATGMMMNNMPVPETQLTGLHRLPGSGVWMMNNMPVPDGTMMNGMTMKNGMWMKDGMPVQNDGMMMNGMNMAMMNMHMMSMMNSMMPPSYDRYDDMIYVVRGMQLVAMNIVTGKVTGEAPIMSGSMMMMAPRAATVIKITAKQYEYYPKDITVKKGVPVTLEFTSLDVTHGFTCPGLGIRTDITPDKLTDLTFTPSKVGSFEFHCDVVCGPGHTNLKGMITVTE